MQTLLESLAVNAAAESLSAQPKKEIDRIALPPPTTKPVDLAEMHRILEFDAKRGPGDFQNAFSFGIRPNKIAKKARKSARKLLPNFKGHKDDQDAVRHALGSFLLTRQYGAADAKQILDGHERSPGILSSGDSGTPGDALQDLYNNRVGRQAALDPRNKGKRPEQVIMELYRAGKLQTRPFLIK